MLLRNLIAFDIAYFRCAFAALAACALATSGHAFAEPPRLSARYAQFVNFAHPKVPRSVEFRTASGAKVTLEAFRGKVVLLNFWATWCPPCIWEMPSLDKLHAALGGDRFAVVAVSIDRSGLDAVRPFFLKHRLEFLQIYTDQEQKLGSLEGSTGTQPPFLLYGLPISYLIDKDGRALGYVPGALKWDSPGAVAFLRYFIEK